MSFLAFSPSLCTGVRAQSKLSLKAKIRYLARKPRNMTFEQFNEGVVKAAEKAPNLGKSLKLNLDEGIIFIDMTQSPAVVSNEDKDADTVVTTSVQSLDDMRTGKLNPMMAMMGGKVKIKGDMSLAMKLKDLLS